MTLEQLSEHLVKEDSDVIAGLEIQIEDLMSQLDDAIERGDIFYDELEREKQEHAREIDRLNSEIEELKEQSHEKIR